jgi:integrase
MKEKLTAGFCLKTTKAGRYSDGGNLHFLVKPDGRKSWVFRFVDPVTGNRQDMGLGRYGKHYVTLAKAREAAAGVRAILLDFKNPIEERKRLLREARENIANQLTFGQCAKKYIAAHRAKWRNAKHTQQWENTLATHAADLTHTPVGEIDSDMVFRCLEKIWYDKTETATRTRQRIEAVLNWATARKLRHGDNPARWKGLLDALLPSPADIKKVQHRSALPYSEIGGFMADLREKNTLAGKALQLQILTNSRPGEACEAEWKEIDLNRKLWVIPGERMKAGKEHMIPLSPQMVNLLKTLLLISNSDYVFPGLRPNKPITTAAGMKLVKELRPGFTQHSMRSTFRDWAGETTAYPREVIEMAMAHQLKDKAEAAYARGNLIDKRRRLMRDWANYCEIIQNQQADNVTEIRRAK